MNDLIHRKDVIEILLDEGWHGNTMSRMDALPSADLPPTLADALKVPEVRAMLEAATELKADLISRGECRVKKATGETAYLVNAGRSAWHDFCAALAAFKAIPAADIDDPLGEIAPLPRGE